MSTRKRILITPGEPAGIGPDILLQVIQKDFPQQLIAIADPDLLTQRAKRLNLPLTLLPVDLAAPASAHRSGVLPYIPISLGAACTPGILATENAAYVIASLKKAATLCLENKDYSIVTGPVHKAVINDAGIAFSGHTEFFAECSHTPLTVMLFVLAQFKVALVTTHLPLSKVAAAITAERLIASLRILNQGLRQQFGIEQPRIAVCGLNPHAGEMGHLGQEEIAIITPALNQLRQENMTLLGPLSADTIFTPHYLNQTDAVLAMYHDQALPLVKYLGFHHAVNMTLGLPFIRTSVDHGTALDLAGSGKANAESLQAAIDLAARLAI